MNVVVIVGRLTKDPELKYTGTGKAVVNMTVAVNRGFGKDEADFLPVVAWEKTAENCGDYLEKGKQVAVTGRIQTRTYEAKDGSKRYITEIAASQVEFLSPRSEANERPVKQDSGLDNFETVDDDEELPF